MNEPEQADIFGGEEDPVAQELLPMEEVKSNRLADQEKINSIKEKINDTVARNKDKKDGEGPVESLANEREKSSEVTTMEKKVPTPETAPSEFLDQEFSGETGIRGLEIARNKNGAFTRRDFIGQILNQKGYAGSRVIKPFAELCQRLDAERVLVARCPTEMTVSGFDQFGRDEKLRSEKAIMKLEAEKVKLFEDLKKKGFSETDLQMIESTSRASMEENILHDILTNNQGFVKKTQRMEGDGGFSQLRPEESHGKSKTFIESLAGQKDSSSHQGKARAAAGVISGGIGGWYASLYAAGAPAITAVNAALFGVVGVPLAAYGLYRMYKSWKTKQETLGSFYYGRKSGKTQWTF